MKLKSYCELTKEMVNNYIQIKKEYNNITKEYIQKLSQLSSNYSKIIAHYKSILEFSGGELEDLLQSIGRIHSIILSQAEKLQSFINGCQAEEEKNKINQEKYNNFEKLSNEFLLKEKKISKLYLDLETYYKNLYNSYQLIENSLAANILSKENKKISLNEILNQEFNNIFEKEKILIKAKEEINKPKNDFFTIHDEIIKIAKQICMDNISILKSNINCFISLYANYCKNFFEELEKAIKGMVTNSNNFDPTLNIFGRDININNYKIRIINNRYIEDKNKKLNLEYLDKIGYIIKDNKIILKDEDIYEIVKIMYGQFQFINEKNYNLTEEQIKINVKNLTLKLLAFDKKQNLFNLQKPSPLNDGEIKLLFKYLEKSFNRLQFLKVLNLFRAKGIFEIPEKEFEILKSIFLLIANKVKEEKDIPCAKLIIILSQTFYCKIDGKNIYIQNYLKNHDMILDLEIWEKYLNESIDEELNRTERIEKKDDIKVDIKYKIKNVLSSQLIPFCDNMIDFGMPAENIYKIIDPILLKHEIKDDLKNILDDLIKSKEK